MVVMESREFDDHEQICFFSDRKVGLKAIVAIHSTVLGPAAGGTRFKPYDDDSQALDDALRLSRSMSYKSALAGLPVGGGKAVIIGDPRRLKTRELLHAYGRFIDRIGSHFATGEDVGMAMADIEMIKEVTPYVGGTSDDAGDPSLHTAVGLLHGLRAVLKQQFGTDSFKDVRVAVQGLGAVGWRVAEGLHEEGARLVVSDVRADLVEAAVDRLAATPCAPEDTHRADVDIFAPCALGGVITLQTAGEVRARAVAGSANNQLASPEAGAALAARGILFAPDYVINAGGIISGLEATYKMPGRARSASRPLPEALSAIGDRLLEIFERSRSEGRRPEVAAEEMARELIGRSAH